MQFNNNKMNLQKRIEIIAGLSAYVKENNEEWRTIKTTAGAYNSWFIPVFIDLALENISKFFLNRENLEKWASYYHLDDNIGGKRVGLVMAGNIPLVGFHDLLSVFISGHRQTIKLSSKDDVLVKHLVKKLTDWDPRIQELISFADMLKGCDAYIATGSNNSARYFEQYFSKYPNIIRRNRTAVAVLSGKETETELQLLSDDIHQYFGLGCRNVTRLFVPDGYDFVPLLKSFGRYEYFGDHHKYKNNYDYQLSIALLNNVYYMTNGSTLLIEDNAIFSAISRLNYSFYKNREPLVEKLKNDPEIQCIVGQYEIPFGQSQSPGLLDYADGIDTMQFLLTL